MDRLGGARRADGEAREWMPPAYVQDEDSGSLSAGAYDVRRTDRKPSISSSAAAAARPSSPVEVSICADTLETESSDSRDGSRSTKSRLTD